MLELTPTWAIWSNGNTPKLGQKMVGSWAQKPAISLKRCKIRPRLTWRTNRKKVACALSIGTKSMTLDDLERSKFHFCRKKFYGAHQKKLNGDKLILSAAKSRPMILVSRNIRYMTNLTKCNTFLIITWYPQDSNAYTLLAYVLVY